MKPTPPKTRLGILALTLVIVAFAITSCARELPTGLLTNARTATHLSGGSVGGGDDASALVTVTLANGHLPSEITAAYNATVVDYEAEEQLLTLRPAAGVLPADLARQMALDPRLLTAEQDGYLQTAEARQQSFAFDDGHDRPGEIAAQPAMEALHLASAHDVSLGSGVRVADRKSTRLNSSHRH